MKNSLITIAIVALGTGFSHASVTAFGQTFYSTNTGLTSPSGNVVWTTPTGENAELHTTFDTTAIAVGETLRVNFNIGFTEPQGDGGNGAEDGIRFGLLDLTTQTNADGIHANTTATGYNTRFNWTGSTAETGGDIRERGLGGGASVNYLTSSGVYEGPNDFNGFGLVADGTSYDASYSATRITPQETRVDFSINGESFIFTDAAANSFSFDTFALAKIGDDGDFMDSSSFTISNFEVEAIPEPSGLVLLGCSAMGLLLRRRR